MTAEVALSVLGSRSKVLRSLPRNEYWRLTTCTGFQVFGMSFPLIHIKSRTAARGTKDLPSRNAGAAKLAKSQDDGSRQNELVTEKLLFSKTNGDSRTLIPMSLL